MSSNIANDNAVLSENILVITQIVKKTKKIAEGNKVYKYTKRAMDIAGGLVGILFLIPMVVAVYIANLIAKENGPIFYTQERIGKDGKLFKLYKFRSMVVGADEILAKYLQENPEAKKEYKKYKKLKYDPRITKVGNFIRKTSIDEFPQFINILKGDMSLVGPRPYLPREQKDMGNAYDAIITCKPGLTGYWQVNGRNDIDFEERTQMDIAYIHDRCLWFDIKLCIKTFFKMFKKEGA